MKLKRTIYKLTLLLSLVGLTLSALATEQIEQSSCPALLNFKAEKLHSNKTIDFCSQFKGKTLLVVNTASQCGFTPQFASLDALYRKYKDQGLEIIGFPSDNFFQEHDDAAKTAEVCYKNYGVSFTMVATSSVRGSKANHFYKNLIAQADASPKWNFYKYLVNKQGEVVSVHNSRAQPLNSPLETEIKNLLNL